MLLIFRIDRFMLEIVITQKEGCRTEKIIRNKGRAFGKLNNTIKNRTGYFL